MLENVQRIQGHNRFTARNLVVELQWLYREKHEKSKNTLVKLNIFSSTYDFFFLYFLLADHNKLSLY